MEAWREELHDDLYHSFKGQEWKHHKYIRKEGNRYIYPEDVKSSSKAQKGWISDAVSSVGNAAATVGAAVSNAATSAANAVSDTWNTIASAVGSTATDLYNSVSSAVSNAISEHKDEPNWPKQKGQSETHSQVGIAEKTNVPWNEKLNNYIKTRLAIIGDDKERLSDLYTAVSYLTYNHLNSNGWISKPATAATPLHEGLDLASLAKAIDVDVSDLTEEDVAALTYALWGVLDAKIRGTKNPLVEGKGQIKDNIIDQIQGKPQQRQQLLNKINSNKDRLAPQNTASKTKNSKSVVIKPSNKKLIHSDDDLYHHGILGQKWGIRRFQNPDGTLTEEGKKRYASDYQRKINKYVDKKARRPEEIMRDHSLMAGTKLYRATSSESDAGSGSTYVTYLDADRKHYTNGYIRARDNAQSTYEHEYELTADLNIAGRDTLKDVMSSLNKDGSWNREIVNGFLNTFYPKDSYAREFAIYEKHLNDDEGKLKSDKAAWDSIIQEFTDSQRNLTPEQLFVRTAQSLNCAPKLKGAIIKELKARGYNAMTDEAGVGGQASWQREGVDPLIMFDRSLMIPISTRKVSIAEETSNRIDNQRWLNKTHQKTGSWSLAERGEML